MQNICQFFVQKINQKKYSVSTVQHGSIECGLPVRPSELRKIHLQNPSCEAACFQAKVISQVFLGVKSYCRGYAPVENMSNVA